MRKKFLLGSLLLTSIGFIGCSDSELLDSSSKNISTNATTTLNDFEQALGLDSIESLSSLSNSQLDISLEEAVGNRKIKLKKDISIESINSVAKRSIHLSKVSDSLLPNIYLKINLIADSDLLGYFISKDTFSELLSNTLTYDSHKLESLKNSDDLLVLYYTILTLSQAHSNQIQKYTNNFYNLNLDDLSLIGNFLGDSRTAIEYIINNNTDDTLYSILKTNLDETIISLSSKFQ